MLKLGTLAVTSDRMFGNCSLSSLSHALAPLCTHCTLCILFFGYVQEMSQGNVPKTLFPLTSMGGAQLPSPQISRNLTAYACLFSQNSSALELQMVCVRCDKYGHVSFLCLAILHCRSARDDLTELGGDLGLACPVVLELHLSVHLPCILRSVLHGVHALCCLRGRASEN